MSEDSGLVNTVVQASVEVDGRKTLLCAKALQLAEQLGVKPVEIGKICNTAEIKITSCQLGCFQ